MDPVSIFGLTGSVLTTGKVVTSLVTSLGILKSKYKSAGLMASLLIGQLTTMKAALNKFSCFLLVLEDHITWLDQNGIDRQLKGKAKFLWNESEVKELNNYLNSKANALHSLLTAVQSRTSFDRNQLLQKPESQKVFRKVEDGRSSLSVFKSRSGTFAETSGSHVAFDFDKEIAATNVHRNVTIPPDDEQ